MQLVDETCLQILADCRDAATNADIFIAGDIFRALQGRVDSLGHKNERSCRRSCQSRFAGDASKQRLERDKAAYLPTIPSMVHPAMAHESARTCFVRESMRRRSSCRVSPVVVHARRAAVFSVHLPPRASCKKPLEQLGTSNAERIIRILARTCTVTIERNRKRADTNFRHTDDSSYEKRIVLQNH